LGLQQFGVIPFEIRTLKIGHTEQRRTQRFYIGFFRNMEWYSCNR